MCIVSGNNHQVSEIDLSGRLLGVHGGLKGGGDGQLSNPNYMAVDHKGRDFLADYFNSRVVVLSSKLKFLHNLLDRVDLTYCIGEKNIATLPFRVLFLRTGELLVSTDKGGVLSYRILPDNQMNK